jgi:hypothetical protein
VAFRHGAAEDVRRETNNGRTPMYVACLEGYFELVLWLLLHGAANNTSTGHIDEYFVGQCLSEGTLQQRRELEQSLGRLQADHSNLVALVLSAVCEMSRSPLLGTGISLKNQSQTLISEKTSSCLCEPRRVHATSESSTAWRAVLLRLLQTLWG